MYQVPLVMGHEFSGEIVEIGKNINDFKIGDKVCGINVAIDVAGGGQLDGLGIFRDGGFAEFVKVPKKYLVGQLNRGFYYMMEALDFERMYCVGWWRRIFDDLVSYTKEERRNGKPLRKDPLIRQKLAQMTVELEVARLLFYQIAFMLDKGSVPAYQSSMEKLFTSEVSQRLSNAGMQILGLYGQLKQDTKWAPLQGVIERHYRSTICETIAAGTSEIQRNIIALRGLELPVR